MSVDFTKQNKKTNFDYLKEYLNTLPDDKKEEALEFLGAISSEMDDLKDEIKAEKNRADESQTEIQNLEEDAEYSDVIDPKLGPQGHIHFKTDNIACQSMMEELEEAIARGVTIIQIENALRAL